MKILTLAIISLTTLCVTAGAQDATPAGTTAQADKQFLQQLEHNAPAPSPAAQPSPAPVDEQQPKSAPVVRQAAPVQRATESEPGKKAERTVTASTSQEKSQGEVRPVEKKVKKDAGTKAATANTERVAPPVPGNEVAIETHPVRKVNQDRTARTTPLDPFYEPVGRASAGAETKSTKVSRTTAQLPPEVAIGAPQTVTVTKTTTTVPAPAPREEDNSFFHRLFHHRDRTVGE